PLFLVLVRRQPRHAPTLASRGSATALPATSKGRRWSESYAETRKPPGGRRQLSTLLSRTQEAGLEPPYHRRRTAGPTPPAGLALARQPAQGAAGSGLDPRGGGPGGGGGARLRGGLPVPVPVRVRARKHEAHACRGHQPSTLPHHRRVPLGGRRLRHRPLAPPRDE